METICISKEKFGQVVSDVGKLISDFESIMEEQNNIVKQRLSDIKECKVEGKSEKELDEYLQKRGIKVE